MSLLDLVNKRKSTRRYSSKPVPPDVLNRCLEAARLAPSACNSQPWQFIVVNSDTIRDELAKKAFSGVYSMNSFAKYAPVIIAVVRDCPSYIAKLGGYLRGVERSLIDIGIACEHLILQAEEIGLGSCWLGWFNEKAVKEVLGLPKQKRVDILISLGYPQEEEARTKKRRTLDDIRRFV